MSNTNSQINVTFPNAWKAELDRLARIRTIKEGKTITSLDLIRRAVRKTYALDEFEPNPTGRRINF